MLRAGNAGPNQPTKVYFAGDISYAHQLIIDRFNALHKNKIEIIPIDLAFKEFTTNDRKELLARALRGKSDKVDIFSVDQIWVQRFAKWAEPLDGYFSKEYRDSLLNYALNSCYSDNKLVAVPINIDVGIMYYRKDLIMELKNSEEIEKELQNSMTWDNFISLGEKLNSKKHPFYIFPAEDYEGLVCSYVELILDKNRNFFDGRKIDLLRPASEKALELLKNLIYKYKISPESVTEFDENSSLSYFIKHNGMFLRGWPSYKKDKKNLIISQTHDKLLAVATLPHFKGFGPSPILGGWNLMLSRSSKKKDAALAFMRFIESTNAQRILVEQGGYLPILSKFYKDSSFAEKYPELKFYYKQIQDGVHRPYLVDYTRISDIIAYYVHEALLNKISNEQALRQATNMIESNKILIK